MLFEKPYPAELPKLSACGKCNRGKGDGGETNLSDDEAYVRDRLLMHFGVDEHPVAALLLKDKMLPNLNRPEFHKQRQQIVDSMHPQMLRFGPDQLVYGPAWLFEIDLARFEQVMQKMIWGLYAHHMGTRMPDDYRVIVVPG